jgi:CO dehydrogenase/acetyl-CoA synthase beta subunit
MSMPAGMPMMPTQFGGGEGVKLSFKNAKISIERIVFKNKEK